MAAPPPSTDATSSSPKPCAKCKSSPSTLESRSKPVCQDCFQKFISNKLIRHITLLGKQIPPYPTRRYALGLSFGVSSSVLLSLLAENVEHNIRQGRKLPFELVVVHVAQSLPGEKAEETEKAVEEILQSYREKYPRFEFIISHITLPSPNGEETSSINFATLSPASREDLLRILTRQALIRAAKEKECRVLLVGHSTTAIAEMTLAEAAKGRGRGVSWLVRDGEAYEEGDEEEEGESQPDGDGTKRTVTKKKLLIHHPLRETLRHELSTYARLFSVHVGDRSFIPIDPSKSQTKQPAVVSHRSLSIEDVMTRYFADVELQYPSIVANVARTTGKLLRAGEESFTPAATTQSQSDGKGKSLEKCRICRMVLDEEGDERWNGEVGSIEGEDGVGRKGLCYGCRSALLG